MNNKYILNITMLLFVSFLLLFTNSCGDDDEDQTTGLQIVRTLIDEAPGELSGTIELNSSDFEYTVAHDWCLVTKNGNVLNIEAEGNYDYRNRSTEIVIISGDKKYRVPVTQRGVLFEFTSSKFSAFNFGLIGGERTVRILSNIEYDIFVPEEDKDWVTVAKKDNGFYDIVIEESAAARNSTVTFKYYDKELTIAIRQYDFYTFDQLLGPATMTYFKSPTDTIETEVEVMFTKKADNELWINGVFNGIERKIPIYYIDGEDGELRFRPTIIESNFDDPGGNAKVKTMLLSVFFNRKSNISSSLDQFESMSYNATSYYPAKFNMTDEGVLYEFKHSELGFKPNKNYVDSTQGIAIIGANATGQLISPYPIYDKIYHPKILKKLATEPVTEP